MQFTDEQQAVLARFAALRKEFEDLQGMMAPAIGALLAAEGQYLFGRLTANGVEMTLDIYRRELVRAKIDAAERAMLGHVFPGWQTFKSVPHDQRWPGGVVVYDDEQVDVEYNVPTWVAALTITAVLIAFALVLAQFYAGK